MTYLNISENGNVAERLQRTNQNEAHKFRKTMPPFIDTLGELTRYWSIRGSDLFDNPYRVIVYRKCIYPVIMGKMRIGEYIHLYAGMRNKMTDLEYRLLVCKSIRLTEKEYILCEESGLFSRFILPIDFCITESTYHERFGPELLYVVDLVLFKKEIEPDKIQIDIFQRWHNRINSWIINLDKIEEAVDAQIALMNWSMAEQLQSPLDNTCVDSIMLLNGLRNDTRKRMKEYLYGVPVEIIAEKSEVPLIYADECSRMLELNARYLREYDGRKYWC